MSQDLAQHQLTDNEFKRYSPHLLLEEFGVSGQLALKAAHILVIGMGGLGSPVSLYLAAAGVGQIVIADFDSVDSSNLQRQILYNSEDIGREKVAAARARLLALNPEVKVRAVARKLEGSALQLEIGMADVVLDCSDNLATRYLISQACVVLNKPLISGAAIGFDGQLMVFDHRLKGEACYHCLFPNEQPSSEPPPDEPAQSCGRSGVLGPVVGTIGSLQALEAIKLLVGMPSNQVGRVSRFDGRNLSWYHLTMSQDPNCLCSGYNCSRL